MTTISALVALMSYVWIQFKGYFIDSAKQLAPGIHNHDLLVSAYIFFSALLLQDIKSTSFLNAELVSWLLPMSSIWFTLEMKLLANLHQGSPFHPSWFARGLAPLWATDQVLNATFWLATLFMTAISTYYTGFTIQTYIDTTGWLIYAFNGIHYIGLSGTWLLFASSGLPSPVYSESFPYLLKPFMVDRKEAVRIHLFDMYIGIALIAAGFVLKIADDKKILYVPYSKLVAYVLLTMLWVYYFLLPKILVAFY
jgi:hypothetical protein